MYVNDTFPIRFCKSPSEYGCHDSLFQKVDNGLWRKKTNNLNTFAVHDELTTSFAY